MTDAIPGMLVSILLVSVPVAASAEWAVKARAGGGCAVESSPESLPDGYQTTTARIVVDARSVAVTSPSVFDPGFDDIAIEVDQGALTPMDRLADPRTATFESRYAALVDQFKRGLRARLQLRFWPTWPATGTHSAVVSLIGFTRAYAQLEDCK